MNNFFQKELAPYADQIDKDNTFPQLRVSDLSVEFVLCCVFEC